jgi:hypothetical protein
MPRPLPLDLYARSRPLTARNTSGTRTSFPARGRRTSASAPRSARASRTPACSSPAASTSDYPDLNLVDSVVITGADGSIAYEGFVAAQPRDLSDTHSIGVTFAGWMAQREVPDVPGDLRRPGRQPVGRHADRAQGALLGAGDQHRRLLLHAGQGGLVCALPNQALGAQTLAEAWYQAPPGCTVAAIGYRGTTTSLPAGWVQRFVAGDRPRPAAPTTRGDARQHAQVVHDRHADRYVAHRYSNGTAATPAAGASVQLSKLAVYGNHGLTTHDRRPLEPDGLYLSDILKNIAQRFCPMLDTSGVQTNNYVVQHAAYRDRTTPYDAFLDLNKYALWHLGVWDNRQLVYRPYDLTDYDWEIRTDDPGTTFSPQGPSTDSLFNGIAVTYTDPLTGVTDTITPDTTAELADTSSDEPVEHARHQRVGEITLSTPCWLRRRCCSGRRRWRIATGPKTPGTITTTGLRP